jgi:hypothetical protein
MFEVLSEVLGKIKGKIIFKTTPCACQQQVMNASECIHSLSVLPLASCGTLGKVWDFFKPQPVVVYWLLWNILSLPDSLYKELCRVWGTQNNYGLALIRLMDSCMSISSL